LYTIQLKKEIEGQKYKEGTISQKISNLKKVIEEQKTRLEKIEQKQFK